MHVNPRGTKIQDHHERNKIHDTKMPSGTWPIASRFHNDFSFLFMEENNQKESEPNHEIPKSDSVPPKSSSDSVAQNLNVQRRRKGESRFWFKFGDNEIHPFFIRPFTCQMHESSNNDRTATKIAVFDFTNWESTVSNNGVHEPGWPVE